MPAFLTDLAVSAPPLVFLIGVVLLLGGGHWLVEGSVGIARRLGVPDILIGLTIVACGTSAPELFFNVTAALSDKPGLSFGNVVGSNIANLGLVLGCATFVSALVVHPRVVRLEIPLLLGTCVAMLALAAWTPAGLAGETEGHGYGRIEGIVFASCFVLLLASWITLARRKGADAVPIEVETSGEDGEAAKPPHLGRAFLFVVVGLAALILGGRLAEMGATGIARMAGMSEALIGLTIVAIATSLPEVVTVVIALRRGLADLAVGNVVGSNLFNVLLVFGATTIVAPVPLPPDRGWMDLAAMTVLSVMLAIFSVTARGRLSRWETGVLLACYVGYMGWSVVSELGGAAPAAAAG